MRTLRGIRGFAVMLAVTLAFTVGGVSALASPEPVEPGTEEPGRGNGGGKDADATPSPAPEPEPTAAATPEDDPRPDPKPNDGPSSDDTATAESTPGGSGGGKGVGVIKLDRRPWDEAPNNEPRVGCTFQIDFYNYPEDITRATYTFSLWPPTGRQVLLSGGVTLDGDPAGGGRDLDAEETVNLTAALTDPAIEGEPHHRNGYHVKLVVRARSTAGADQKQKVFWVPECPSQPTTEPPTVLPTTVRPPRGLAVTGRDLGSIAGLMLILLLMGTAALRRSAKITG